MRKTSKADEDSKEDDEDSKEDDEDSKEDDEQQFPNWASAVDHWSEKEIIRNVSQKCYYRHSTTENNRSLNKEV